MYPNEADGNRHPRPIGAGHFAADDALRVAGIHRGVLADMNDEEREAAVEADLDRILNDVADRDEMTLRMAVERSIEGAPPDDLRSALTTFDEDELYDFTLFVEVQEASSDKAELIESIVQAFDDPMSIREFLYLSHPFDYRSFMDVADAGGRLEVDEHDLERLRKLQGFPPFLFLYHDADEGKFVNVVYEEVLKGLGAVERDAVEQTRSLVADYLHYAETAAQLYGLISIDEFAALDLPLKGWMPSSDEVGALLDMLLCYQDREYRLERIDDVPYLAEPFLSVDFVTDGGLEPIPPGLVKFQNYILERQRVVPRRPLEDVVDASSLYDWTLDQESGIALRDWLDAHVPDDDSDYSFSERVMEELYEEARMSSNPMEVASIVTEYYEDAIFEDDPIDFFNELLGMVFRFVNDIPLWQNHGYSANGLHERETGRRQFFNPDGTPMKVGRNDPCPCGSGKKYKNCCGRPRRRPVVN